MSFEKIMCKIFKRRFRYQAELVYTPDVKNGMHNITRLITFDVDQRNEKLIRTIKKSAGPSFIKAIPACYLRNGELSLKHISYLGWY